MLAVDLNGYLLNTKNNRPVKTMPKNPEIAAIAVTHDIKMLRLAYECQRLGFAYTAWFVHYRAIMDFFNVCPHRVYGDDIIASDYVASWDDLRNAQTKPARACDYREAVNKLVAHLSDDRVKFIPTRKKKWKPNRELTAYLRRLAKVFVRNLPSDKKPWFSDLERELRNPLGPKKKKQPIEYD